MIEHLIKNFLAGRTKSFSGHMRPVGRGLGQLWYRPMRKEKAKKVFVFQSLLPRCTLDLYYQVGVQKLNYLVVVFYLSLFAAFIFYSNSELELIEKVKRKKMKKN